VEVKKDVSRTAWESFIRCKRCFYLEKNFKPLIEEIYVKKVNEK
jgi:hypothetical protein